MNRILVDGPWSYEQSLLIMKKLAPHESRFDISLSKAEFWVQIHSLPFSFCSEKVVKTISSYVGEFIRANKNTFDGTWKSFIHMIVSIDVTTPLKRKMKLKKPGEEGVCVDFKYEKMPSFCFL